MFRAAPRQTNQTKSSQQSEATSAIFGDNLTRDYNHRASFKGQNLNNLVHIYDTLNAHVFRVINSQYGDDEQAGNEMNGPLEQQ